MGGQRFSKQAMLISVAWGLAAPGAIAEDAALSTASTPREIVGKFEEAAMRAGQPPDIAGHQLLQFVDHRQDIGR